MKTYTYRVTSPDGTAHESLRLQLMGDALLDARTMCLHGPGGEQTIEIVRYPGAKVVLSERRRDGRPIPEEEAP